MQRLGLTNQSIAGAGVDAGVVRLEAHAEAELLLSSTGGTTTADGTEQTLYIDSEPLGCWEPLVLFVDLDAMQGGDTTVLRVYYRLSDAGGLQLLTYASYTGADGGLANGAKLVTADLYPNRHGFQVTLQQTAGVNRAYPWELMARA